MMLSWGNVLCNPVNPISESVIARKEALRFLFASAGVLLPSFPLAAFSTTIVDTDKAYNLRNERIYDTSRHSYLPTHPELYLHREIKNRNVVIVGEVHSNPLHHLMEFRILSALTSFQGPSKMSIGMECFYRQHQEALDNFVYDHGSLKDLKRETNWQETWGYDLSAYARILNYAHMNKIRLVGLNIPLPIVEFVASRGIRDLPSTVAKYLPEVDLSNTKHRKQFVQAVNGMGSSHGQGNSMTLDHLYEAQALWDEYMAQSAALYLKSYPNALLMVVAGIGHVMGRVGIPNRIRSRTGKEPFVISPFEVNWNDDNGLPQVDVPPSKDECDWIWYTEHELET